MYLGYFLSFVELCKFIAICSMCLVPSALFSMSHLEVCDILGGTPISAHCACWL